MIVIETDKQTSNQQEGLGFRKSIAATRPRALRMLRQKDRPQFMVNVVLHSGGRGTKK